MNNKSQLNTKGEAMPDLEDGVYFNLPEQEYHSLKRMSASGIKKISTSVLDFWSTSWLNVNREESFEDREAFKIGKAYHSMILEGLDVFNRNYAVGFDEKDYPKALKTNDDIKAFLGMHKLAKTGTKAVLIERLRSEGVYPVDGIIEDLKTKYALEHSGKTFIKKDIVKDIEFANKIINHHPQLKSAFKDGYPEVSILWTDEESGVKMKSRLDYLKTDMTVDYKTLANVSGMNLERAVYLEMAKYKYHIQGTTYNIAVENAKKLINSGKVHGDVDGSWLEKFVSSKEHGFMFVFQQKGKSPVVKGKMFKKGLPFDIALDAYKKGLEKFKTCLESNYWLDDYVVDDFEDELFPLYMVED